MAGGGTLAYRGALPERLTRYLHNRGWAVTRTRAGDWYVQHDAAGCDAAITAYDDLAQARSDACARVRRDMLARLRGVLPDDELYLLVLDTVLLDLQRRDGQIPDRAQADRQAALESLARALWPIRAAALTALTACAGAGTAQEAETAARQVAWP